MLPKLLWFEKFIRLFNVSIPNLLFRIESFHPLVHLSTCARGRHGFRVERYHSGIQSKRGTAEPAFRQNAWRKWVPFGSRINCFRVVSSYPGSKAGSSIQFICVVLRRGCRTEAVHGPFARAARTHTPLTRRQSRQSIKLCPLSHPANQRGLGPPRPPKDPPVSCPASYEAGTH
jgi:hypothetical protein